MGKKTGKAGTDDMVQRKRSTLKKELCKEGNGSNSRFENMLRQGENG